MTPKSANQPGDVARQLGELSIIGERQALAYTLRELYGFGRAETADKMDCSRSNVDNLIRAAKSNLSGARDAVALAEEWQSRPDTALHGASSEQEDNDE